MSDTRSQPIVIVAKRFKAGDDPAINLFRVEVRGHTGEEWPETIGSRELLCHYLKGLRTALAIMGYPVASLEWNIPESWGEPSGIRWTIPREGLMTEEELDSEGNVLKI